MIPAILNHCIALLPLASEEFFFVAKHFLWSHTLYLFWIGCVFVVHAYRRSQHWCDRNSNEMKINVSVRAKKKSIESNCKLPSVDLLVRKYIQLDNYIKMSTFNFCPANNSIWCWEKCTFSSKFVLLFHLRRSFSEAFFYWLN